MSNQRLEPPDHIRRRSILRCLFEGVEGLGVAVCVLLSWPVSRKWLKDWGAIQAERESTWPGDSLVDSNHKTVTRAIDIGAPAEVVWSWLVQFGFGRAGFYSYELLERLVGIPVVNVESIVPEWQLLSVGDEIVLHPKSPGIPIGLLKSGEYICFGESPETRDAASEETPGRSWSMYIEPKNASKSRLILRSCIEYSEEMSSSEKLASWFGGAIDFVMEQRMLRTLKRLAESDGSH